MNIEDNVNSEEGQDPTVTGQDSDSVSELPTQDTTLLVDQQDEEATQDTIDQQQSDMDEEVLQNDSDEATKVNQEADSEEDTQPPADDESVDDESSFTHSVTAPVGMIDEKVAKLESDGVRYERVSPSKVLHD